MTKKTRNILFLFFVILFFTITPLASLYTAGYKINFSWPPRLNTALQKTGMFIIETEPDGAQIFIDEKNPQSLLNRILNQDNSINTPAKIKNLLPGEYNVKIELDGYWSWQKKLSIYPGEATQIKDIKLFKKDLPIKIIDAKINDITISPDKKYLTFIEDGQAIILNLNNEVKNVINLNENYLGKDYILWSPDSKKVLINNTIIKIENNFEINLSKIIGSKITNLKWSQTNDAEIFYQYLNTINIFNINSQSNSKIFEEEICLDYTQDKDSLIIISQYGNTTKIKKLLIKDKKITKEFDFPYSSEYKLLNNENNLVHLYDNKFEILYLINLDSYFNPLEDVINNIKKYQWVSQSTILYYNDFEIWLYNVGTKDKNLLTRISDKIAYAEWHPTGKYVIYSTEKNINIIELDKRERRNITELTKVEKIYSPQIDNNGEIIYFGAKIGNQEGIYKLEI